MGLVRSVIDSVALNLTEIRLSDSVWEFDPGLLVQHSWLRILEMPNVASAPFKIGGFTRLEEINTPHDLLAVSNAIFAPLLTSAVFSGLQASTVGISSLSSLQSISLAFGPSHSVVCSSFAQLTLPPQLAYVSFESIPDWCSGTTIGINSLGNALKELILKGNTSQIDLGTLQVDQLEKLTLSQFHSISSSVLSAIGPSLRVLTLVDHVSTTLDYSQLSMLEELRFEGKLEINSFEALICNGLLPTNSIKKLVLDLNNTVSMPSCGINTLAQLETLEIKSHCFQLINLDEFLPSSLKHIRAEEGFAPTSDLINWSALPDKLPKLVTIQIGSSSLLSTGGTPFPLDDISRLSFLEELTVTGATTTTYFNGELPRNFFTEIAPRMKILNLAGHRLIGTVPEVLDSSIEIINLTGNHFSNWKPFDGTPISRREIGSTSQTSNLAEIYLSNNVLTEFPDDDSLKLLKNLKVMDISGNSQLGGPVPRIFDGSIPNLKYFAAGTTNLSGSIPNLSNATSLSFIDLSNNDLCGSLPDIPVATILSPFLVTTPPLNLFLGNNKLSGSFPSSWKDAYITAVDISNNMVTGEWTESPINLNPFKSLSLSLRSNPFSGHIFSLRLIGEYSMLDFRDSNLETCDQDPQLLVPIYGPTEPFPPICACGSYWKRYLTSIYCVKRDFKSINAGKTLSSDDTSALARTKSFNKSDHFLSDVSSRSVESVRDLSLQKRVLSSYNHYEQQSGCIEPAPRPGMTQPISSPTQSVVPSSPCTGSAPSPSFACINGVWTSNTSVETPTFVIPGSTQIVHISGNLTTSTIQMPGVGSLIIVHGCIYNLTNIFVTLTLEDIKKIEKSTGKSLTQSLIVSDSDGNCPSGSTKLSTVGISSNQQKFGCKRVKVEKATSSNSKQLSGIFIVSSSRCNIWWIIVVSVIGGLILIGTAVALFVLSRRKTVHEMAFDASS